MYTPAACALYLPEIHFTPPSPSERDALFRCEYAGMQSCFSQAAAIESDLGTGERRGLHRVDRTGGRRHRVLASAHAEVAEEEACGAGLAPPGAARMRTMERNADARE